MVVVPLFGITAIVFYAMQSHIDSPYEVTVIIALAVLTLFGLVLNHNARGHEIKESYRRDAQDAEIRHDLLKAGIAVPPDKASDGGTDA